MGPCRSVAKSASPVSRPALAGLDDDLCVAHTMKRFNRPNAAAVAAAILTAVLACGDYAAQAQAAAERWVATWATSQTLILEPGSEQVEAGPMHRRPRPRRHLHRRRPPTSFLGGGFRFRRTCRQSTTRQCGS